MSVRKLRSGRITTITAAQFVGQEGTLFWDEPAGLLRLSDGSTPGGKIVGNLALAATGTTPPINPFEGELWYNPSTKELLAYYDAEFRGTINLATETVLGGVRLGPGVITNSQGQIIIDSSGLEFSFGDFAATDNRIQTINPDQDAIILSNGTGAVRIVGEFFVHPTNGDITDYSDEPYLFGVGADGQVKIFVPDTDPLEGAMEIIGTSSGESVTPAVAGVMLHITGNNNVASSIYNDGVNRNPNFIGRRYNGSALEPTQVLANDVITRFSGQGYALGGFSGAASATVSLDALENFTATNQGSEVKILTTPLGAAARAQVARFNNQEGLALKKVTLEGSTSGTVSVQATATAGTNTITLPAVTGTVVTTGDSASVSNTMLANSTISGIALGNNLAALTAGTYLTSGGTYNGSTARTFAVDATTDATVSKVVARDANGTVSARNYEGNIRDLGSIQNGATITVDFATDYIVFANLLGTATIAFSNITAGRPITVILKNTSGGNRAVTFGVDATQTTGGNAAQNINNNRTGQIIYTAVGTALTDVYCATNFN